MLNGSLIAEKIQTEEQTIIKYEDGTMVISGRHYFGLTDITVQYAASGATAGTFYLANNIIFDEEFIEAPNLVVTLMTPGHLLTANIQTIYKNKSNILFWSTRKGKFDITCYFLAIGRWK